jgi:hypothetical protein
MLTDCKLTLSDADRLQADSIKTVLTESHLRAARSDRVPKRSSSSAQARAGDKLRPKINLKGLVIADGWCDPETHVAEYGAMVYGQGLVDAVRPHFPLSLVS